MSELKLSLSESLQQFTNFSEITDLLEDGEITRWDDEADDDLVVYSLDKEVSLEQKQEIFDYAKLLAVNQSHWIALAWIAKEQKIDNAVAICRNHIKTCWNSNYLEDWEDWIENAVEGTDADDLMSFLRMHKNSMKFKMFNYFEANYKHFHRQFSSRYISNTSSSVTIPELKGPSGIGKTTIATEWAKHMDFFFAKIDLSIINNADLLIPVLNNKIEEFKKSSKETGFLLLEHSESITNNCSSILTDYEKGLVKRTINVAMKQEGAIQYKSVDVSISACPSFFVLKEYTT